MNRGSLSDRWLWFQCNLGFFGLARADNENVVWVNHTSDHSCYFNFSTPMMILVGFEIFSANEKPSQSCQNLSDVKVYGPRRWIDDSRNETAEEAGLYSRSYLVVPRNDNLSPRGPKVGSATLLLMRSS